MPAFFFPPLAFFAIVCYPPLQLNVSDESAHDLALAAAAWHAHPMSALSAPGTPASALLDLLTRKGEVDVINLTRNGLS